MAKIKVSDKEFEAVFNVRAAFVYKEHTGKEIDSMSDITDSVYLLFACICAGEKRAGRDVDITIDFLIDNLELDDLTNLIQEILPKKK